MLKIYNLICILFSLSYICLAEEAQQISVIFNPDLKIPNLAPGEVFHTLENQLGSDYAVIETIKAPKKYYKVKTSLLWRYFPKSKSNRDILDAQGKLLIPKNTELIENGVKSYIENGTKISLVDFSPSGDPRSFFLRNEDFLKFTDPLPDKIPETRPQQNDGFFGNVINSIKSKISGKSSSDPNDCTQSEARMLRTNPNPDCQGSVGSCVGYSTSNAIEFANYRYLMSQIDPKNIDPRFKPVPASLLTEPLYLLSKKYELENSKLAWVWRDQRYLNSGNSFLDGAFTGEMLYTLSALMKDTKIREKYFLKQNSNPTLKTEILKLTEETKFKIDALIKSTLDLNPELNNPAYLYTFYDIEINNPYKPNEKTNLKKEILKLIDDALEKMIALKGQDKILYDQKFANSLEPMSVFNKREQGFCNSAKLAKTIVRHICSNLSLHPQGLKNIYKGNHAVSIVGFMDHGNVAIVQNPNGKGIEKLKTKDICEGLDQMYTLMILGTDTLIPSQNSDDIYPSLPINHLTYLPDLAGKAHSRPKVTQ